MLTSSTTEFPTPLYKDPISLRELYDVLWRGKWLILCVTALCTLAAIAAVWLSPTKYRAVVVVSPVTDAPGTGQLGGLGSLVSQFGGLASLAGLSVGNDSKKAESLAVLGSEELARRYITENNLLPVLYPQKWDSTRKQWKETNPEKIPTLWKANQRFRKKVRAVSSDSRTGLITLTITWTDPHVAAQWANDLVKMTNDYLRNEAIHQSERHIAYLNEQAARTDVVGVKQAVYSLLQIEINKVMLARGSEEYAFKIIDPAVAPELPFSPRPKLWTAGGFAAGILLSLLAAFIRVAWARS